MNTLEADSDSSQAIRLYEQHSALTPDASSNMMQGSRSLKFSFPSNIFFLFGGLCFLVTAAQDLQENNPDMRKEFRSMSMIAASDFAFSSNNVFASHRYLESNFDIYRTTIIFGAGFYILNASVDLFHCIYYVKKSPEANSLLHRSIRSSSLSAIFFGIAAWIDFWACLSQNINYDANIVAIATSTLYLFSAISSVSGLGLDFSNRALILGFMGECLFVIGSILDCLTSYVSDPDLINLSQTDIHMLAFISSVLWVIDAFLYLAADIIIYRNQTCSTTDSHASLLHEFVLPGRSMKDCGIEGLDEQAPTQSILV